MSIHRFALVAGLLLSRVSATTPAASSPPVSSQAHVSIATCNTVLGTKSVKSVPTTTITRTIHDPTPVVVLTTTQDTVTVTPAVSTDTVTDYETTTIISTATTITDTFSTTSTEIDTATVTLTPSPVTATIFTTLSTTSTSTSTIATSLGFTPIADTLPPSPTVYKRSLLEEEDDNCAPYLDDLKYPQKVVCHERNIIKATTISTITENPITTTAPASTTTVTVTNTITSNSIVLPSDVSTTLSYSTTSTITETSVAAIETTTVTSTATVLGAVTTTSAYAACATNNIAGAPLSSDFGSLAGKYVYSLTFSNIPGYSLSVGNTASAYDCCASCQASSKCAMSYFVHIASGVNYCYLASTTVCASSTYGKLTLTDSVTAVQVSNGNCGRIINS
ncbi:uncharacterized protein N7529_008711 [Penicillium soppii]|jgi:hypothetical protein|uniref:uncharacterized protein n=1 Tax=Penicillium soppii TaxID=69789 RepID=UPI0025470CDA|nr:uncharacterized protein N7529_008711 [Penicillium soppii]KAJ5861401.1 hypothetical protein N7529_008711 [Penicillium soppii]